MRAIIVGAGPVGVFCGMVLARGGHDVTVIEADPPPTPTGQWQRHGVMQFNLPHFFRPIVRQHLLERLPDVWDALLAAGGIAVRPEGFPEEMTGLQCRRSVFERVLWSVAAGEPNMVLWTGRAENPIVRDGRVIGIGIDGDEAAADVVIVAAGRTTRIGDEHRASGEGGSCGFSYVARMYRARSGTETPASGLPMGAVYEGYQAIVFPQDDRTLSALIVRPTSDVRLSPLRHNEGFDAAASLIPQLAPWTNQELFEPATDTMAGSGLSNTYRGQLDATGSVPASGLFFVGDSVCTTNPAAGRGVSLGLRQASELLSLLEENGNHRDVARQFDAWCVEHIRPWYEDHVQWDASLLARFRGEEIDPEGPISSDVICSAAEIDPSIMRLAGPFMAMMVPPTALKGVEENARAVLRSGWRPTFARGPTSDELAELLAPY